MKKYFSFPTAMVVSLLVIILVTTLVFISMSKISSEDRAEYLAIMQKSTEDTKVEPYIARQRHERTCKEMWYIEKGQRLQIRLKSREATLVLDRNHDKTEIIEQMNDVICCMQTELFYRLKDGREVVRCPDTKYRLKSNLEMEIDIKGLEARPMQLVRYFKAEKASYHYSDDRLIAEEVDIAQYLMPGHTLVDSFGKNAPILSGRANKVEFSLIEDNLNFAAVGFQASLYAAEGKK